MKIKKFRFLGTITFHVRRKSAEMIRLKRQRSSSRPPTVLETEQNNNIRPPKSLPRLIELNSNPNSNSNEQNPKIIYIQPNVTEVGDDTCLETSPNGIYVGFRSENLVPAHFLDTFFVFFL